MAWPGGPLGGKFPLAQLGGNLLSEPTSAPAARLTFLGLRVAGAAHCGAVRRGGCVVRG